MIRNGHEAMAKLLLTKDRVDLDFLNLIFNNRQMSLLYVAENRYKVVIKLLFKKDINLDFISLIVNCHGPGQKGGYSTPSIS